MSKSYLENIIQFDIIQQHKHVWYQQSLILSLQATSTLYLFNLLKLLLADVLQILTDNFLEMVIKLFLKNTLRMMPFKSSDRQQNILNYFLLLNYLDSRIWLPHIIKGNRQLI